MPELDKLVRYHRQGFDRVSKVVDASADYASNLVVGKADKHDQVFNDPKTSLEEKRRLAIAKNQRVLLRDTLRIIRPRRSAPVCYGVTNNNLREFEFFERQCASLDVKISGENIYRYPRYSLGHARKVRKQVYAGLLQDATDFYARRDTINAPLVQQQLVYTREFLRYLLSFSADRAIWPSLMVLANDHYPTQVAISMLMKGAGIPRLYIQHAEVTSNFPQLDFEYNILRNEKSLATYESIGSLNGEVFVLSRYDGSFAGDRLQRKQDGGASIVIYPSSMSPISVLDEIIGRLRANEDVQTIFIKPHPNSKIDFDMLTDADRVSVVQHAPSEDYIAVVGNSSVVTELLHGGIPVYQNFDFDSIRDDYYGFVASGLTKHVPMERFSTRFWEPYTLDDVWLDTFSKLDPTVRGRSENDRERLLSIMGSIKSDVRAEYVVDGAEGNGRAGPLSVLFRKLSNLILRH